MGKLSSSNADTAVFGDHAVTIAKRQYFQPGDETVYDMFERVATWVAQPEPAATRDDTAAEFYRLMAEQRFCPGGRVLAGAATEHGNVLNCFVQDGSPEPEGTNGWVLRLATKLALVTKVGGGNGLNLDPIPPKRRFDGRVGQLYLTVDASHPDHDAIQTGTFLDLVRDEMVTKGYKVARFVERQAAPDGVKPIDVPDSVEGIWESAAEAALSLLAGKDVLVDLSLLRPVGTPVRGSGGASSGPSSFAVEIFDNFAVWAGLGGAEYAGPVATLRYVFAPTLRAIRQGGCLHPDTLVHTSRGTLRLEELVDGFQLGWQDHHIKVATDQGWKVSPQGFNNGVVDTLRVTLANGQTLRGTSNHKLKVLRPDGKREWVEFGELQKGDNVIQVLDQHTGAPVMLRPVDLPHHNTKPIRMPEVLDERLAFFLGYLWGDGFVSTGRVGFSVSHGSPMVKQAPRIFDELFGLGVMTEQKDDDASLIYVTKSAQLIAWLKANDLIKEKARELAIPKAIRMSPRPVLGAFLRGLFEADGTLTHGMPTLSTASVRLAEDVATMMAGLGIPTKRRTTSGVTDRYSKHSIHSVRVVSHKGLERFLERIGFMEGSRLAAAGEHVPDEGREQSWILPHASAVLTSVFESMPAGAKGRPSQFTATRKTLSRYIRGERNLTATGYDRLRSNPQLVDRLPELAYDEYYVPVLAVAAAGPSLTLDISVDENKTYLAGGFVTHNTRRGAGMATISITHPDVHDFITAKDLERERDEGDISTFNISVLVSDRFMQSDAGGGVLREIAQHAWATGEPGLIYIDRINEHNVMQTTFGDIKSTNPCVTADTWVTTQAGARQVGELVGKRFCAVVDGNAYGLESDGFFSTGTKQVYRLTTKRGYEVRLTGDHRLEAVTHRTRKLLDVEWRKVDDLEPGDAVTLQDQRTATAWGGDGTFIEGWLLGQLVGDGTFLTGRDMAALDYWGEHHAEWAALAEDGMRRAAPGDHVWVSNYEDKSRVSSDGLAALAARYGIRHGHKVVTDEVERASEEFYRGFLRGLFDADGSVQGTQQKGVSVRLAQSELGNLKRVQRMLARLGILSTIYAERRPAGPRLLPDGHGGHREYEARADHELVITKDNLEVYARKVGFEHPAKQGRLEKTLESYSRQLYRERFYDEIVSIEPDGVEEVFDVTVEHVHAFDANGFTAHNCGEIPLYPGEPCDLGAVNIAAYVNTNGTGIAGFDMATFRQDVATCVRFLDDVLDVNHFALEDNREMSMNLRRLGLGVMGLADALIKMGYGYNTDEGRAAVHTIITALREAATEASEALAEERGAFPLAAQADIETPRRNVAILTVAPTGTTSMLMGVSSGVEPVFAPFIHRKIGATYHALIHPLFKELLDGHRAPAGYAKGGQWDWDAVVKAVQDNHGSVQGLDFIPEDVRRVLICAHDITPADHVKMQATVQQAFDGGAKVANSISKTINLPNSASVDDVFEAYRLAFETHCKGITVYRDGSREFQVLSTTSDRPEAKKERASVSVTTNGVAAHAGNRAPRPPSTNDAPGLPATPPVAVAPPAVQHAEAAVAQAHHLPGEPLFERSVRLSGFTDKVKLLEPNGEKRGFYVTVNKQDDFPTEVFIQSGKGGDEANADSEALGRVVSIALQYGVPAEAIIKTLRGINGGMYGTYQGRMVASKADIIAVALETAGVENVLNKGKGCPDCGAPLRFEEGCQKCESCGYSKCG